MSRARVTLLAALRLFGGVAALGLLLWLLVLAALWWGQEKLLFLPERLAPKHRFDFGADVHELAIDVPGAKLSALHLKLPAPRGLVFYLHGNGGSLDGWFSEVDFYRRANFDLFMLDYRGYGKSSGRIESQAQLEADVLAAWQAVAPHYAGQPRVLIGRSLGSGLAAGLAAQVRPELTVLISPYASMAALAAEHYPWVPAALLRYPLRTDRILPQLTMPVLLIHGSEDRLINPDHSLALARLQPAAQRLLVRGAGHNDIQRSASYQAGLRAALARL